MSITYTITAFDEVTGQISVKAHGGETSVTFVVDVPLNENNLYITGDELHNYIMGFIPHDYINRKVAIRSGVANSGEIKALIPPNTEPQYTLADNQDMWAKVQFEKDVAATLVKFGVLQSDPTSIPVSNL